MSPMEYTYLKQDLDGKNEEILLSFLFLSYESLGKKFEDFFKANYQLMPSYTHLLCYLKYYRIMSMSQLASIMNVSRQTMTKMIDSLSESGMVKRSYNAKDRRAVFVESTEFALKIIDTGERRFISHMQNTVAKMSSSDQREVLDAIKLVSKFLANLKIEEEAQNMPL